MLRPEYDATLDDFRVFYGTRDRMLERVITGVDRYWDGDSTYIHFVVDGAEAIAFFPAPVVATGPSLTLAAETSILTGFDASETASMSFVCLGE